MPVPVVYTDFTSMYPTVQCLLGLWELLTADSIAWVEVTEEVRKLLADVTLDGCFRPEAWSDWCGFAEVEPNGDVLPVRAQYKSAEWNVGVNPLFSTEPLWYALPDLVGSVFLCGKRPKIRRAFRMVACGRQEGLRSARLRGGIAIDPTRENLFRRVIEARQRVKRDRSLSDEERDRTEQFLKTLANAGSYGVFIEMNRKETREKQEIAVFGKRGRFAFRTAAPEDPGRYAFPPVGALITAAARLMLALLERSVTDAGGTWAFADTDSMAIVASKPGGIVACEGGALRSPNGNPAIRALSWSEVNAIVKRFEALNPYDRAAVPGSILKIEDINFDANGEQREIWAYAISAKRYALFAIQSDGDPEILDGKEHGLGIYLNPIDPEREDRDWICEFWEGIVREALGGERFDPKWGDAPAMRKTAVTTPNVLDRFDGFNRAKRYANRVKPSNFLLSATVDPFERPPGIPNSRGFHLIAPYSRNPEDWLRAPWIDLHSGDSYRIKARGHTNRTHIRVQTLADVLDRFRNHPEAKSADSSGNPANRWTIGLLARQTVRTTAIIHIGKESNLLERQEEGVLLADPQAVYLGEHDHEALRALLADASISELSAECGVSEEMLRAIKRGDRRASPKALRAIVDALERMASS